MLFTLKQSYKKNQTYEKGREAYLSGIPKHFDEKY